MKDMTLEEKIGQLFIIGFNGTEINKDITGFIDMNIGGVILFKRNVDSLLQIASLCNNLQNAAKNTSSHLPLFISIDHEGGRVNRLPPPFTLFPPAINIGNIGDIDLARRYAGAMARELSSVGINIDFAPVMDIFTNPDNTVIGDRAFGVRHNVVSDMGVAVIKGLRENGIIPVAKHFPGHGNTIQDSHFDLPVVSDDYNSIRNLEILPFKAAILSDVEMIMTAHVLYENIDRSVCATMSKPILQGLLREELQFKGVVISDDMKMKAITKLYGVGEASVLALEAGVDIILICEDYSAIQEAFDAIKNAFKSGRLSFAQLDSKIERILSLKKKFNIGGEATKNNIDMVFNSDRHKKIKDEIMKRSVV